jgi:hypothetical protein
MAFIGTACFHPSFWVVLLYDSEPEKVAVQPNRWFCPAVWLISRLISMSHTAAGLIRRDA